MANLNKVMLIGRLTRDPEVRYTTTGQAVAEFGLAVNRKYKDKAGALQEETTFVDIKAWAKQAETIGEYLKKGRPVFIEGRLELDRWEQDGQKRSRMRVVVENFQFLGGRDDGEEGGGPRAGREPRGAASATPPQVSEGRSVDDYNLDAPTSGGGEEVPF